MAVPPKSGYFSHRWLPTKERFSESLCLRTQFLLAVHSAELGTGKMNGCSSARRCTLCDTRGGILSLPISGKGHFSWVSSWHVSCIKHGEGAGICQCYWHMQRQKEDIYCWNPGRRSPVRRSLEQVCAVAGYGLNPA